MTYLWLISFIVVSVVMFLLVPAERIKRFNLFGFIAGFVVGMITLFLMDIIFNYWTFTPDFLTFADIPLFLVLTWWPLEIAFAHYFIKMGVRDLSSYALILVPPSISTAFHYFSLQLNLMQYQGWSLSATFLFSFVVHIILAMYLRVSVKDKQAI